MLRSHFSLTKKIRTIAMVFAFSIIAATAILSAVHANASALTFLNATGSAQTLTGYPSNIRHIAVDGGMLTVVGNDGKVYTQDGPVQNLDNVAKAFAGKTYHTPIAGFAIKTDGTLWSWGRGVQLGRIHDPDNTGSNQDDFTPKQITGLPEIQDIQIGIDHVLALDINGNVWSWGDNLAQQLGTDTACPNPSPVVLGPECTTTPSIIPAQVIGLSNIQSISAGRTSSLALTQDGKIMFWGSLCRVESNYPHYPTPVQYPGTGSVKQALTDDCSLTYLTNEGTVFTLGFQGRSMGSPVQVQNLQNIQSISSDGYDTRAARDSDGNVFGYHQVYFNNQPQTAFMISNIGSTTIFVPYRPTYFEGSGEGGGIVVVGYTQPDSNPPEISHLLWSQNPKPVLATTTLTVPVSDNSSGIQSGEFFLGDDDPGQGNGVAMQVSGSTNGGLNADLTTTLGTNFPTGVYKVSVRAQDNAGNWSSPISDYLVVYNPDGPKMLGKRTIAPSLANGDILPGLITGSQTDKAKFGFSVKYNQQGQINSNSDFMFSYNTGTHCNNPNQAVNCHEMTLDATTITWLTTQDTNNSTGIFQGTADMVVDGQQSSVIFRVTGIDGERLSSTATDRFQVMIYSANSNPNTDTPLFRVNSTDIARGNIKIN